MGGVYRIQTFFGVLYIFLYLQGPLARLVVHVVRCFGVVKELRFLSDARMCESKPCLNGGTCMEQDTYTTCLCKLGFTGSKCEGNGPLSISKI